MNVLASSCCFDSALVFEFGKQHKTNVSVVRFKQISCARDTTCLLILLFLQTNKRARERVLTRLHQHLYVILILCADPALLKFFVFTFYCQSVFSFYLHFFKTYRSIHKLHGNTLTRKRCNANLRPFLNINEIYFRFRYASIVQTPTLIKSLENNPLTMKWYVKN